MPRNSTFSITPERLINKEIPPPYVRLFAYLIGVIIITTAIYSEAAHQALWWLPVLAIAYPVFTHVGTFALQKKSLSTVSSVLILSDSAICGATIVVFGFDPLIALSLYMILSAGTFTIGGFFGWIICQCMMILGLIIALLVVAPVALKIGSPSLSTLVISLLSTTFYTSVLGFFSFKQAKALITTQTELKKQQQDSAELSRKLAKYLPPQVLGAIFSGQTDAKLQTKRKKLTVFFSDIKGFAQISEELQPEALTDLLNSYFTEMSLVALKYGGTIDKFVGDAILIFFGDPGSRGYKQDAHSCVSMGLEMQKKMKQLRQQWQKQGISKPLQVRMGINTGYCTVGNFGAETRMDYTIIGREVNLASRLESVAQPDEILISESTYNLVRDRIVCRDRGQINVKGFSRTVPIFEVIDHRSSLGLDHNFFEFEKDGFTLYLDVDKVKTDDRDSLQKALDDAAKRIREKVTL